MFGEAKTCIFILKDTDPGAPDANLDQQRNRITAAAALKQAKVLADSGMWNFTTLMLNGFILMDNPFILQSLF